MFENIINKKGIRTELLSSDDIKIKESFDKLYKLTDFYKKLPNSTQKEDIKIRWYIIKNDIKEEDIICSHQDCNNQTKFNKATYKFNNVCCNACKKNNINISKKKSENFKNKSKDEKDQIVKKRQNTNQERYNGNAPICSKEIKEKIQKTNLEKFGSVSPLANKEVKEKISNILKEKYGNDIINPGQISTHQEKVKMTNLKNLGVEYPAQSPIVREKMKRTNIIRYDKEFASQSEEIKNNTKEVGLLKWGVNNPYKSKEVQKKYNVTHYMFKDITNLSQYNDKEFIEDNFFNGKMNFKLREFMIHFNVSETAAYKKLKQLKIEYKKYQGTSEAEQEVYNYVLELIKDNNEYSVIANDRSYGAEYDILIYKNDEPYLGIEYNGTFWHSYNKFILEHSNNTPKELKLKMINKHLLKTELAVQNNFKCLHIFENEWENWNNKNHKDIWKSVIRTELQLNNNRIYARKCQIKEVTKEDTKAFLEFNHLQGSVNSKINLGLYYNNTLISIMTFGKNRFRNNSKDSNSVYELIRFCSLRDYSIVGGASKLLKYFERNYNLSEIISYANRRWSEGNLYKVLGFTLENKSQPNHFYIKDQMIYSRMKFQKHKLLEILGDSYNHNLSAVDNVVNYLDYSVIWDSGNYVFQKIK